MWSGLSAARIAALPSYRWRGGPRGSQTSCVVCMAEFEARQSVRVLPCRHEFHARCVDKWLRNNRTCPICRRSAADPARDSPHSA